MGGVGRLALGTVLAGVLVAALLLPYVVGIGLASNQVTETIEETSMEGLDLPAPETTTMTDSAGTPIAYFYSQNRVVLDSFSDFSPWLWQAVVATEDRRFMSHKGFDWRGTTRVLLKSDAVGGGSTLTQQYVKNHRFLVQAKTETERAEAIEATPFRKLQEAKMALVLEQNQSKEQILTNYLNLVAFGPSVYGAQAAAKYFFGVDAKDLTLSQSALMAAMINNPNKYNPFLDGREQDALDRRNIVLDLMTQNRYITKAQADEAKADPMPTQPNRTPNNCISADNHEANGFFCTYALDWLQNTQGMTFEDIQTGGYTIQTTLDPTAMAAAKAAVDANADPNNQAYNRVANVMAVVKPGAGSRKVLALAANRPYGNNPDAGETLQRLVTTFSPFGAGSTFKIFTAAAAMEKGLGTSSIIDTPAGYKSPLAPAHTFGNYPGANYPTSMSLTQALATSPNTGFVKLEDQVGLEEVARMSVALGLRGYELPAGDVDGAFAGTGRTFQDEIYAQKMASYTLGVTPVSPLELANVGATLASRGQWCQPTPIDTIRDRNGAVVPMAPTECEQVVDEALADTLTFAMQKDREGDGTAARAAQAADWTMAMASKTGTTNDYKSSAFLGYTPYFSSAVLTWDYLDRPRSICVDNNYVLAGSCTLETTTGAVIEGTDSVGNGGMTGGSVPAATWFTGMKALQADQSLYSGVFDPSDPQYVNGVEGARIPSGLVSKTFEEADQALTAAGFVVNTPLLTQDCALDANQVVSVDPATSALPGSVVTLTLCAGPTGG